MTEVLEREKEQLPEVSFEDVVRDFFVNTRAGQAPSLDDPPADIPPEKPTPPVKKLRRSQRKAAQLLDEAVGVLEEFTWVRGHLAAHVFGNVCFPLPVNSGGANGFCVLGAVDRAAYSGHYSRRIRKKAVRALHYAAVCAYDTSPVMANDRIMRGKDDAIALLKVARREV
jgi:hypothetical protein